MTRYLVEIDTLRRFSEVWEVECDGEPTAYFAIKNGECVHDVDDGVEVIEGYTVRQIEEEEA